MEVGSMVSSQAVQQTSYAPRPGKEPQANNGNAADGRRPTEGVGAPPSPQLQSQTAPQARKEGDARSQQAPDAQRAQPPRPVVNAQGQKTGTIINTTA